MKIKHLLYLLLVLFAFTSCHKDDVDEPAVNNKTLFMYLPYSSNLTYSSSGHIAPFIRNVEDLEDAIKQMGRLDGRRVIVFFADSRSTADMFEITCEQGVCICDTFKTYTNLDCTTEAGLTGIIRDMKTAAPAEKYSLIIGGHGMAWLPKGADPTRAKSRMKYHWEQEGEAKTRFFGDDNAGSTTEISTLVSSLNNNGIKTDYIMFDDCYMSSLEVAYELRDVTDYLIACPTEIMAYGMPYYEMGRYLLADEPDYNAICQEFFNFYNSYATPYGTIAVTSCNKLQTLATYMKEANNSHSFDSSLLGDLQKMDGYSPTIFYDFGDYVKKLCSSDEALQAELQAVIDDVVPYKAHTENYCSAFSSDGYIKVDKGIYVYPITNFSGITTSEPSINNAASTYKSTPWYLATH